MKTSAKLNLLSFPKLREEIALGQTTRLSTKISMVVGYANLIVRAISDKNWSEASVLASKLAGIIRCWEAREKAEAIANVNACLKTSAVEQAGTPSL